jgi:nucleoside-diphosphate-sugar epimerase
MSIWKTWGIMYFDFRKNDVLFYLYSSNSNKLRSLGWKPKISLNVGLAKTVIDAKGKLQ